MVLLAFCFDVLHFLRYQNLILVSYAARAQECPAF